jgi:hypothetical protein
VCLVKFSLLLATNEHSSVDVMKSVVDSESGKLAASIADAKTLNNQFQLSQPESVPHKHAGCIGRYLLDKDSADNILDDLFAFIKNSPSCSLQSCRDVFASLNDGSFGMVSSEQIEKFSSLLCDKFHLSTCFKISDNCEPLTNGQLDSIPNGTCDDIATMSP